MRKRDREKIEVEMYIRKRKENIGRRERCTGKCEGEVLVFYKSIRYLINWKTGP
jgi:hypothetical protein